MCHPAVAIAITAISAGYTVTEQRKARKKADRRAQREQELNTANKKNQIRAINERLAQEKTKVFLEKRSQKKKSLQAQSIVVAGAAERGVAGLSIDALIEDFQRQESEFKTIANMNEQFLESQAIRQREAAEIGASINLENIRASLPPGPDYLGQGLRIAGSAADAYAMEAK